MMLAYLRENTGNWIIKIFLGIIVIVFVFLGVGSLGSKTDDTVASIDGEPISIKEFQQSYNQIVEQLKSQFGRNLDPDILKALNVEQQALNAVIDSKLLLKTAEELGIEVSKEELQESLLSFNAFHVDGQFNLDLYRTVLRRNGMTPETFERDQAQNLKIDKVRQMVTSSINVSELEARDWYLHQHTKIAVDYLKFDPRSYIDIEPDDAAISAFFEENKDRYKSEPKIKAVYLKFDPRDHLDKAVVSDEDIFFYFEENPERFETAEKVEARHILIKLDETASEAEDADAFKRAREVYEKAAAGEDFATLAQTYSEGPTKENGGYLGTFEQQSMVKPFGDKAFSMEAGEISEPVRTQFGWHVIKVESKTAATRKTFEQVKDRIKEELALQEMQNMAYSQADEAFELVIDGDDLEQVSRVIDKPLVVTQPFSGRGEGLDLDDPAGFAKAAFALEMNDISDVIQLGDAYLLINVVEKIEPADQPLAVVKERVAADLKRQMQKDRAKKEAGAVAEKIESVESIQTLAQLFNLELKTTKAFVRNDFIEDVGSSPDFIAAAFSLNESNPLHPDLIETDSGIFIIGLNRIELPQESEITAGLKEIKQEITWRKQTQYFQEWLAQLKAQHEIVYDPDMVNL